MLRLILKKCNPQTTINPRNFSISHQYNFKVVLVGGCGSCGQPLAMLLKLNNKIKELCLYDIRPNVPGVAADLSHINTTVQVKGYGPDQIDECLKDADIVFCLAGIPRKPGMKRDDLFQSNARTVYQFCESIPKNCPKAFLTIVTNPINSLVPIAAAVLKKHNVYDPKRLFGESAIDTVRARTFVAQTIAENPINVKLPVIGAHSTDTILPIFSQCEPQLGLPHQKIIELTKRVQSAGTENLRLKLGTGSETLVAAYTMSLVTDSFIRALSGEKGVFETLFVESKLTEAPYFSSKILLGKDGIEKIFELPRLNDFEQKLLDTAIPEIKRTIQRGIDYTPIIK